MTMPCPQPHSRLPENNAMAPEAVCFPARSAVHLGSPRSIHRQRRRSRAPPIAPCAAERTHETSERRRTLDVRIASQTRGRSQTDRDGHTWGFDHGVGHPLLLLCDAKAPNFRKNKAFKDLSHYAEWPKVADAVIEAMRGTEGAIIAVPLRRNIHEVMHVCVFRRRCEVLGLAHRCHALVRSCFDVPLHGLWHFRLGRSGRTVSPWLLSFCPLPSSCCVGRSPSLKGGLVFSSTPQAPNAGPQAPPIAAARYDRRLSAVACRPMLGAEVATGHRPDTPQCHSLPLAPRTRHHGKRDPSGVSQRGDRHASWASHGRVGSRWSAATKRT